jgi:serine/threonine-protein kinase HipA
MEKIYIYLENGTFLEADSFGASGTSVGEIVFNTSLTGYQEITTDPSYAGQFITFTMPVTDKPYVDKRLFSFFEGLIPEGWLLDIASKNWKINRNDRMGLLLVCCQNCIGAVSVIPIPEDNGE